MKCIFADEAGCLTFNRKPNVSRFFVLCTVICDDYTIGEELMTLRRALAKEGIHADADQFHASEDPEVVRQRVIELLAGKHVRVDATLFEKSKTYPRLRPSEEEFYRHAWYMHLKYVAKYAIKPGEEVALHAASIGTKKRRSIFKSVLNDVAQKTLGEVRSALTFWPSNTDPCLQVADYYAWVIQRKAERGDTRHYDLLRHNIRSEFNIYAQSGEHHY